MLMMHVLWDLHMVACLLPMKTLLLQTMVLRPLDLDVDNKKATITIQEDVKWSDGEPLVADDIMYSYEIIGHKDYTGVRYDSNFRNIVGMEEYHDGSADSISVLKSG